MEHSNNMTECNCECCHCKKIFMLVVLLILSFMAGIMVGSCSKNYHPHIYQGRNHYIVHTKPIASQQPINAPSNSNPINSDEQMEGFVLEVEPNQ